MMRRLLWFVGALAGVVLAAGVTYAASSLSTQRIGLSSEPASAGEDLAPARTQTPTPTPTAHAHAEARRSASGRSPRPRRRRAPTAVPTAVPTVDDHGGDDDGGGDDSSGRRRGGAAITPTTTDWKRRGASATISVNPTKILRAE